MPRYYHYKKNRKYPNTKNQLYYTAGEVADLLGMQKETIKQSKSLQPSARKRIRSNQNWRLYTAEDLSLWLYTTAKAIIDGTYRNEPRSLSLKNRAKALQAKKTDQQQKEHTTDTPTPPPPSTT